MTEYIHDFLCDLVLAVTKSIRGFFSFSYLYSQIWKSFPSYNFFEYIISATIFNYFKFYIKSFRPFVVQTLLRETSPFILELKFWKSRAMIMPSKICDDPVKLLGHHLKHLATHRQALFGKLHRGRFCLSSILGR